MFVPWAASTCVHQKRLLFTTTSWKNSSCCETTLLTQQTRTHLLSLWKHFGCGGPEKKQATEDLGHWWNPTAEFKRWKGNHSPWRQGQALLGAGNPETMWCTWPPHRAQPKYPLGGFKAKHEGSNCTDIPQPHSIIKQFTVFQCEEKGHLLPSPLLKYAKELD